MSEGVEQPQTASGQHWLATMLGPQSMADAGWRLMARDARLIRAEKGARLFQAGDPCREFVMVLAGSLRVQYLDGEGNEIVIYRVRTGETCILTTSCLLGHANYPAEGIVEKPLQAALVPLDTFRRALDSEAVRIFVFAALGRRLVDLMVRIDELAFQRMDRRLAQYLVRHGGVVEATHQEIAVELGSAREVVSRLLKDFERKGWLVLGRGRIELRQLAALARLACD
ncbi:MAG: Crp/Fnr family transcriptional regulator [Gammaproteobacteria bacterium]